MNDWTVNPSIFTFQQVYKPDQYTVGQLAQNWTFTSPNTIVFTLRQNVYWQNIAPANGRQFSSADIVWNYDRLFGLGDGFTTANPIYASITAWHSLVSVTATDSHTVAFTWSVASPELITETMEALSDDSQLMVNPEAVQQWGTVADWHHAIGTGPFILTDFVDSASVTMVKNPNYYGYDERYPQNKLPYVNGLNILIIPDTSTALAAMRTGKIDAMAGLNISQSQSLAKTNPEIVQLTVTAPQADTLDPKWGVTPFNDIRVREAMQMAIDLPTIASSYYDGTVDPWPSTLTSNYMTGWNWPYKQWPADLQAQYAYNPTQAKQLLAAAGYANGFNTNIVADSLADSSLLQIVQSYFAAVGINMAITVMPDVQWVSFVMTNHSQTQMETHSDGFGCLGIQSEPMRQLNKFAFGQSGNWLTVNDPTFNAFYPAALAATSIDAVKQILNQADQYVAQQHYAISLLCPNVIAINQPWLKGFNDQAESLVSTSSGITELSMYGARFWLVPQNP